MKNISNVANHPRNKGSGHKSTSAQYSSYPPTQYCVHVPKEICLTPFFGSEENLIAKWTDLKPCIQFHTSNEVLTKRGAAHSAVKELSQVNCVYQPHCEDALLVDTETVKKHQIRKKLFKINLRKMRKLRKLSQAKYKSFNSLYNFRRLYDQLKFSHPVVILERLSLTI